MNIADEPKGMWSFFSSIEDPRSDGRNKRHRLEDIITIAVVGFAAGMTSFDAITDFACMQEGWFRKFLALPHGIPSHDTFERVFEMLDAQQFERCFMAWTASLVERKPGDVVAIDGKTIRNSGTEMDRAVHMVSAWGDANGLILGQVSTDEKSNEITAIPELIGLLNLEGSVVTIDAMGCQKDIAAAVLVQGADYILDVKENQPTLHAAVTALFDNIGRGELADVPVSMYEQTNRGHGRDETRRCRTTGFVDWFADIVEWPGLMSFSCIESTRTLGEKTSTHTSYVISSLFGDDAQKILESKRSHWGIESRLHWCLDVTFGEDGARLRGRNLAENTSALRRTAMNLLRSHPRYKGSLAKATRRVAFDLEFREMLMKLICSNA
jgi:predicted transposase YbfD/YdcC